MTSDALRLIRNLLFRCFVVGAIMSLLLQVITFGAMNTWRDLATNVYHLDQAAVMSATVNFFTAIKFYLLFVLLAPALAVHWTLKKEQKHQN